MILAVDTSLGSAVGLIDAEESVLLDLGSENPLEHAEVIGDLLQEAARPGIEYVISGMGPGPYTGLRIGIAAARGFAMGIAVPVVPVPSHFAPALTAITSGVSDKFAIVTDARRREVAVTEFHGLDADRIPGVVSDTVLVRQVDLADFLGATPHISPPSISAAALAIVGMRAQAARRVLASAEPLYLRQPDVTMPRVRP